MFLTRNRVDCHLINVISSFLIQIRENTQFKLEIKFTNQASLSDGIQVIEDVVTAQRKSVWMTTMMLNSYIHSTTSLRVQTVGTFSAFLIYHKVGQGNQWDRSGYGPVGKLSYINEKLVYGSTCSELAAESAEMLQRYVIHCSENMSFSWSEIDPPQIFCMQLSIDTKYTLAVNNDYMIICSTLLSKK
jgi:hypothetical protein